MTRVLATPLTAEAFAPYGHVSDVAGLSGLLPVASAFDAAVEAQLPVLQLVGVTSVPDEIVLNRLEVHPFSAQNFLALDMAASIVVVCDSAADGSPDVATLKAFIAQPNQVVTYKAGVWHHKLTPLKAPSAFAMTMRHTGKSDDTVLVDLAVPVVVDTELLS